MTDLQVRTLPRLVQDNDPLYVFKLARVARLSLFTTIVWHSIVMDTNVVIYLYVL